MYRGAFIFANVIKSFVSVSTFVKSEDDGAKPSSYVENERKTGELHSIERIFFAKFTVALPEGLRFLVAFQVSVN